MTNKTTSKITRIHKGIVVSDKMDKTVTVLVERVKEHPIYKKKFKVSKKFKVHDEENQYKVDDIVEFVECKPESRDKKHKVIRKIVK